MLSLEATGCCVSTDFIHAKSFVSMEIENDA